jgi:hypothetical protein
MIDFPMHTQFQDKYDFLNQITWLLDSWELQTEQAVVDQAIIASTVTKGVPMGGIPNHAFEDMALKNRKAIFFRLNFGSFVQIFRVRVDILLPRALRISAGLQMAPPQN